MMIYTRDMHINTSSPCMAQTIITNKHDRALLLLTNMSMLCNDKNETTKKTGIGNAVSTL